MTIHIPRNSRDRRDKTVASPEAASMKRGAEAIEREKEKIRKRDEADAEAERKAKREKE